MLLVTSFLTVISFVFLLTPWVRFIKLKSILEYSKNIQSNNLGSFRRPDTKEISNLCYEHYRHLFIRDYDRENPITARKAIKEWSYALSDKIEEKIEIPSIFLNYIPSVPS